MSLNVVGRQVLCIYACQACAVRLCVAACKMRDDEVRVHLVGYGGVGWGKSAGADHYELKCGR